MINLITLTVNVSILSQGSTELHILQLEVTAILSHVCGHYALTMNIDFCSQLLNLLRLLTHVRTTYGTYGSMEFLMCPSVRGH